MSNYDWGAGLESGAFNYQSPIELIASQIETSLTENCLSTVQAYGFNVDKEELEKALAYDRKQYEQGFSDAIKACTRHGKWLYKIDVFHNSGFDYCSCCNFPTPIYLDKPNFCPNCGAKMDEEADNDK